MWKMDFTFINYSSQGRLNMKNRKVGKLLFSLITIRILPIASVNDPFHCKLLTKVLNILFILQAFSEFTFEPSGGELKPLESKKVKVTFQPVSAKSVRRVLIIFCLFYRPLVSLHLSHLVGS